MKIRYLIGLFLVILMVGCAKKEIRPEISAPAAPEAPASPPVPTPLEQPQAEATPPASVEQTPAETVESFTDVIVTSNGFDPDTITIKAGSTVAWIVNDDKLHTIFQVGGAFTSPKLGKGQRLEYVFEKAGTYSIMDASSKRRSTVVVE